MRNPEHTDNGTGNHTNNSYPHDRLDQNDNIEQIYPYPAIPRSVRPYLERCFQIEDINNVDPDNDEELSHLDRLSEINQTLGLVRAYCGTELSGSAYKAAALAELEDLSDALGDREQRSNRATEELGKFFIFNAASEMPTVADNEPIDYLTPKNIYIAGLLQDRRRLDKLRDNIQTSIVDSDRDALAHPAKETWLSDPTITDADTLHNAVETINIESILISGAETLAKLQNQADNSWDTLDLVRYSEQIIAPIAEVIGFDTLAMSLNSLTKSIRLTNGGRGYLLHRANAMIDRFRSYDRSHSLAHNVSSAFTNIVSEIFHSQPEALQPNLPVNYGDDNQSVYGDTKAIAMPTDEGEVSASWRFRLKTPGSLAWKMYQNEKKGKKSSITPMDILGITAVVDSEDDQIRLFHTLANGLYASNELREHHAPSKISPIHVRGRYEYAKSMTNGLTDTNVDIRYVNSTDQLHYGKVTGFYGKLPFEIQCVTRFYRDSMQIGPLAHIIYKVQRVGKMSHDEVTRWTTLLADIRSRRARLGKPGLVGSLFDERTNEQLRLGENEVKARSFLEHMVGVSNATNRFIGQIGIVGSGMSLVDSIGKPDIAE